MQALLNRVSTTGFVGQAARWALLWLGLWLALLADPSSRALAPDYIQFWSASSLLWQGENPYDPALQAAQNQAAGWDRHQDGQGEFDYLPFYYPPWLAIALMPLLALGYESAALAWLALLIVAVLGSGYLVRDCLPRSSPRSVMLLLWCFPVWCITLGLGQTVPLLVLGIAATWRLLQARRDFWAGVLLATLSIKPQLGVLLVAGTLVWSMRQLRWRVVAGCAACLGSLMLLSTLFYPAWLPEMLRAPTTTPLVTLDAPWLGTSWPTLLTLWGLTGPKLLGAYLLLAVPMLLGLCYLAWRRPAAASSQAASATAGDYDQPRGFNQPGDAGWGALMSLGCVAPFVLAPYARYYDLPLLTLAVLWLLDNLRSLPARRLVTIVYVGLPLVLLLVRGDSAASGLWQGYWFWLLLVGMLLWLVLTPEATNRPANRGANHPKRLK